MEDSQLQHPAVETSKTQRYSLPTELTTWSRFMLQDLLQDSAAARAQAWLLQRCQVAVVSLGARGCVGRAAGGGCGACTADRCADAPHASAQKCPCPPRQRRYLWRQISLAPEQRAGHPSDLAGARAKGGPTVQRPSSIPTEICQGSAVWASSNWTL